MSTPPDAATEAKNIAATDKQSGKGAEAAAQQLFNDYNTILSNGNDVTAAKQWLQDTTAALAKAGVLPDITIGVLHNEKDNLTDGDTITSHDLKRDNFLLGGSTSAQGSFDSVFTNALTDTSTGLADSVNKQLGSNDGSYTQDQFNAFDSQQADTARINEVQNKFRTEHAGLFQTIPGTNTSVLEYLDTAAGGSVADGNIGASDIKAALANPYLPPDARASVQALADQMKGFDWHNRSINDILKDDGITLPDNTPSVDQNAGAFFTIANQAFSNASAAFNPQSDPTTRDTGRGD